MKVLVDLPQALTIDVRVDLRRRDVGVAEHHLHGSQVGAALQQMRREGVTQHVRAELAPETDRASVLLEDLPEALPAHPSAPAVEEQRRLRGPTQKTRSGPVEIRADPTGGLAAERDEPLLPALADAFQVAGLRIQIAQSQGD